MFSFPPKSYKITLKVLPHLVKELLIFGLWHNFFVDFLLFSPLSVINAIFTCIIILNWFSSFTIICFIKLNFFAFGTWDLFYCKTSYLTLPMPAGALIFLSRLILFIIFVYSLFMHISLGEQKLGAAKFNTNFIVCFFIL